MAEVLTQTEIDALLDAVSMGSVETAPAPPVEIQDKKALDWIAYDITSQEKFVRGRMVGLEGIHERFAGHFRRSLNQTLKRNVTVTYANTDFVRFEDYVNTILLPTAINIYQMKEPLGHMIFVFGTRLAYALVDAYYGGTERPFSKIGGQEEFTQIEKNIIQKIAKLASHDLEESWKLNYPISLSPVRLESHPNFVGSIHPSETVAVVSFDVELESLSGQLVIVVQLRALESIQSYLSANVPGELPVDRSHWREHWMRELSSLPLDIRVLLGETEVTLRKIGEFHKGQEVVLNSNASGELNVYVQGVAKYRATLGARRGSSAVKLTEVLPVKTRRS